MIFYIKFQVDTLKLAIGYIGFLSEMVNTDPQMSAGGLLHDGGSPTTSYTNNKVVVKTSEPICEYLVN